MTARERQASGGISLAQAAPHGCAQAAPIQANGHTGTEATPPPDANTRVLGWEQWFMAASAAQRTEMLALAAHQGLLYANQISAPAGNGDSHGSGQAGQRNKSDSANPVLEQTLARLLAGQISDLASCAIDDPDFHDEQLDPAQREAVARALSTPDIFLLQGLPGTGRSRVVAEVLNQAALQGKRALFLANHPSSLDAVLPRLDHDRTVFALRFLDPNETSASLPRHVIPLTLTERQRVFKEQALSSAAKARTDAEDQVACHRAEEACWRSLHEIAEQMGEVRQRLQECAEHLSKVAGDVEREAAAGETPALLASTLAQLERAHLETLQTVKIELVEQEKQHAAVAAELAKVQQALETLRPLAEAKERGRWWTLAWWRATCRGQVPANMTALEDRRQALDTRLQALAHVTKEEQEKCQRLQEQYQADWIQLLQIEIGRRRQEGLKRENACRQELAELASAWQKHAAVLDTPAHRPTEETHAALAVASVCWEEQRQRDLENYQFACRWEDYLAEAGDQLVCRIPEWANVLAGTMAALSSDPGFDQAAAARPFDLLVLEEADQFTESEFLRAARRAARWVLVAETHGSRPLLPAAPVNGARAVPGGPLVARLGCFQKLWQALRCDSPRLHYAWSRENARLCCTLRPVSGQDHSHLEIECVADFPEIELRILAVPKAPPLLAQVVFPADMTIGQAKSFIYRELEEAAVQSLAGDAWLADQADGFVLHLDPATPGEAVCLDLETGLREWITPASAHTSRIEFARASGWTHARVDHWLGRYLSLRDLGRTMALRIPYRMMAGLAQTVNEILFGGACLPAPGQECQGSLEFIAVPPILKDSKTFEKRKLLSGRNGSAALPREGAGLELDLAAPRGADRVPAEVRAGLPSRGFANYLEAQAVIRKLEELVSHGEATGEPVAVVALYEGQVSLLRRLADRSECLRRSPGCCEFGLPGAFRQRERMTVLVSLTRSHGHRAVPFGDRESDLAIALTRARRRLILFGDPGTLAKRSHWHGPLDHLDAAAAALEAGRITALLGWLAHSMQNSL